MFIPDLNLFHPGFRVKKISASASKNVSITQKIVSKLSNPGSRVQKRTRSRIWIHNTANFKFLLLQNYGPCTGTVHAALMSEVLLDYARMQWTVSCAYVRLLIISLMGRSDEIPEVVCAHTLEQPHQLPDDEEEESVSKLPIAGTSSDLPHQRPPTEDLRRSLVKARLATTESAAAAGGKGAAAVAAVACGRPLAKSDSMDSMLGESLLDPPPSMSRMAPRRYQSPSRCGSPSLEAPDHLLLGSRVASGGAAAAGAAAAPSRPPPPTYEQAIFSMNAFGSGVSGRGEGTSAGEGGADEGFRLNRHDLLRRRDLNLFHGLHPRLLHGQPRLSLPPKPPQPPSSPLLPCRARLSGGALPNRPPGGVAAAASGEQPPPLPLTDRLPNHCTLSGKHICQYEEELEETTTSPAAAAAPDRQQPPPAAVTSSPPLPCQPSSSSSSSSSSSLASSPPSGDNYQQGELGGAKAHRRRGNWPGRALRTATPYTRDWSAEDNNSSCSSAGGNLSESQRLCKAGKGGGEGQRGLSQAEMEEVLELLKARASPSTAAAAGRRPSLKDEQLQQQQDAGKSRRSSLDEIIDPVGNGIRLFGFNCLFYINVGHFFAFYRIQLLVLINKNVSRSKIFATTADPSLQGRYILTQSYSISHRYRYLLHGLMKSDLLE
jgi:hypothetical protein